jgi:hypothetical protein
MTTQLPIRLPDALARRLKRRVPPRQRSAFVQRLLEDALSAGDDSDDPLYLAALEVEKDATLAAEMAEWDVLASDGLTESEAHRRLE